SQKLSTAHANRNVPAAAPSVSERPVPESSKDLPGSGMWLARGVRAADFRGAIRDQHASCNSQHDVIVDDRPSAKRFVIATNQRYAALFSASKGCRALLGNGSVAHHKAPATSTTEGSTSARNSDIYVGIDHDPVGVPCQPAPPAFPVLERLLHRRKRLSALLMARCTRAAPSLGSSQLRSDEHTRSAAPSAFVSLLCDTGCLACEQRSVPGRDHTMPGEDRARSAGSMLRPRFIATGFAVGKASARPSDGGDQRQAFDSRSRLRNTEMPGVSAAAVIRGHPAMATDAYTLMRAWRQQRAAAAAIICRAARRYLDAGAAAEKARVSAAADSLAACIKARLLAAWQGVYHRRSRLRRQYTRLVALSLKAKYVACVYPGPMAENMDLAEIHAGLVAELAAAVYAPDRTSRSRTTSNSVLDGTWDSAHGSCQHGDSSYGVPYGLVHADGWGAAAASHRRYCTAASADEGRYGLAVAHRRWWLLRAAWCSLIVHAIAPLRWRSLAK
ncbi:hypothetical protein VaNZ11_004498, partial [Volvox africanus]